MIHLFTFLSTTTYFWWSEADHQGISSYTIFNDGTIILDDKYLPPNTVFKVSRTGEITTNNPTYLVFKTTLKT